MWCYLWLPWLPVVLSLVTMVTWGVMVTCGVISGCHGYLWYYLCEGDAGCVPDSVLCCVYERGIIEHRVHLQC